MEPSEKSPDDESSSQPIETTNFQSDHHRRERSRSLRSVHKVSDMSMVRSFTLFQPVLDILLPRQLKLRFINSPPKSVFTYFNIKAEDGSPIAIELVDTITKTRVTVDPMSSSPVEIVALDGGVTEEIWTRDVFYRNILRPRNGKPQLLFGDLSVTLEEGFGVIGNIGFTDNSSWLRSRKFRLGVKVTGGGVVEAKTEGFYCRDKRGEQLSLGMKHFLFDLSSKVWKRKGIHINGVSTSRLAEEGIHTVKDLRRSLAMNPDALNCILGKLMSKNNLDEIVFHAKQCVVDEAELYSYEAKAHGAFLIFNSVYELIKVSLDGVTFLNSDQLPSDQKAFLDILKREAYENINTFVLVDSGEFANPPSRSSPSLQDDESGVFPDTNEVFWPLNEWHVSSFSSDYDVVIRYKRGDICNDFASHLRATLCRRGISVVEDFDEVDTVIGCRILIIFLTSRYVSSNLLNILKHQRREYQVVYPIFYGISPSYLISNSQNYERFFLQDDSKRWQAALKEVTEMPGYILTDKSESELIDEIVRDAWKVLCSNANKKMIGMDMQVEEILSLLCIESPDVRSIGIWGTVGIGKTAITEEIFRRISVQYETCVFLKDLHKEVEVKGHDAVREDFLSKVLEVEPHVIRISNLKTSFFMSRLQCKRVLVILDDVNDYRDAETFLGKLNYFGPGSRIIITSRNKRVFVLCKINHVYEVKPLDISKSLVLLECKRRSSWPNRTLSLELVKFSNGNPQVLQFLSRLDIDYKRLSELVQIISPTYIPGIFERSCCGLDNNEMSIFLDIACFFRRMDKDNVAMLLEGCGFSTHVGFRNLVDKSLLFISLHNMVDMLMFIQATGREIVCQESAERPGDRSRLWIAEDIKDVLINDTGTSAIEGISLDMSKLNFDANPYVFDKMCNLRLLKFITLKW